MIVLVTVIIGIARIFRGPTLADRMLSAQMSGTSILAIVLLLALGFKNPFLYDIALVFAVLAAVTTVAFVRLNWQEPSRDKQEKGTHG